MKNSVLYKNIILLIIVLVFSSCEVFVIKGKKVVIQEQTEYTQNTPLGTVSLFVSELKNDNVLAATELMAKQNGTFYSADEKYNISAELSRLKRFISNKDITNRATDFIDDNVYNITLEIEYTQKAIFKVQKIGSLYFVTDYDKIQ